MPRTVVFSAAPVGGSGHATQYSDCGHMLGTNSCPAAHSDGPQGAQPAPTRAYPALQVHVHSGAGDECSGRGGHTDMQPPVRAPPCSNS